MTFFPIFGFILCNYKLGCFFSVSLHPQKGAKAMLNTCKSLNIRLIEYVMGGGKSPLQAFVYALSKAEPIGSVLDFFCPVLKHE